MRRQTWKSMSALVLTIFSAVLSPFPERLCEGAESGTAEAFCTYEMQVWNVVLRKSSQATTVRHAYRDVSGRETDPATGCTVCREDQVEIDLPPLEPFLVCRALAPRLRDIIAGLIRQGAPIRTIRGYQVIRSRGDADGNGDRTEFSNHSFGTAIDINPEQNGLYDTCAVFGPDCRLLRGGPWRPGAAGALTAGGEIVSAFTAAGFKWGGEIAGQQKDFMHFSLTGY